MKGPLGRDRLVVEVVGSLAVGGAERVALEVAAGLRARGWRMELLVAGPERPGTAFHRSVRAEAEGYGVPVHEVPFSGLRDLRSAYRLARWLRGHRVGLLHVHNRPQDWQAVALCRLLRIPALYTVHLPYTFSRLRQRLVYAAAGRAVPLAICVSRTVADQVHQVELVPEARIRVIHNGVRMDVFRPPTAEARAGVRASLGWTDGDFGWIMAARLAAQKGQRHLLEAIAQLPADSRSRFALAGEGPLEAELKRQADRLSLGPRVKFLGPRRDVPALLGAADAYACSSLQEGHPLSLLEAMALELPVVAPRLRSIEEIATDGAPIFYGPRVQGWATAHDPRVMAAALLEVERHPEAARAHARTACRHVAEQYSLDAMLTRHEEAYRWVLDRSS